MGNDIDWAAHAETTRLRHIARYANCAQQNTHNHNVLSSELQNIVQAAGWASARKMYDESLQIAKWLWSDGGQFLDIQGYAQLGRQLLIHALEAARSLHDKSQEEQVLGQLGRAYWALGELPSALENFKKALTLAKKIKNRHGQASHLGCLGQISLEYKHVENAEEYFRQALKLAREIPDRPLQGRLLGSLGLVVSLKGDQEAAIKLFDDAIKIAEKVGDWRGAASHRGGMGTAYKFLGISNPPRMATSFAGEFPSDYLDSSTQDGYYNKAIGCFEQALAAADRIGDEKMKEGFKANLAEMHALSANRSIQGQSAAQAGPDRDTNMNIWMRNHPPAR